jgi:hypothetical protein
MREALERQRKFVSTVDLRTLSTSSDKLTPRPRATLRTALIDGFRRPGTLIVL